MGVVFSKSTAAKIEKATKIVLDGRQDRTSERRVPEEVGISFWALVTGPADPGAKRFHFLRIVPDASPDRIEFRIDNGMSYRFAEQTPTIGYARECNGNQAVPTMTVVRMSFIGYDADDLPAFLFDYHVPEPGGFIPPHDHRDNFNGGFSFACCHPGTAIPGMPWAD